MTYRAAIKRRFGPIGAKDFQTQALRFVELCNEAYGDGVPELVRNKFVAVGWATMFHRPSDHAQDWMKGDPLDIQLLSDDLFVEQFTGASSMTLTIKPPADKDLRPSFAQIQWLSKRPKILTYYAQGASKASDDSIVNVLHDKLFDKRGIGFDLRYAYGVGFEGRDRLYDDYKI